MSEAELQFEDELYWRELFAPSRVGVYMNSNGEFVRGRINSARTVIEIIAHNKRRGMRQVGTKRWIGYAHRTHTLKRDVDSYLMGLR